ncbi:MAG TPA: hypothetical protein VHG28_09595 [Longimicrobiaceae bacterium]|nr:hypothetical protein [Longimicrobiaceae bacterium]
MARSKMARLERTLGAATRFLDEMRAEIGRTAPAGDGFPPRLRCIHERAGHATPEYRNLAIPVPEGFGGASPEILSGAIARYAAEKCPDCLLLALDLVLDSGSGPQPVLVAEARDAAGARLFWMQPYRVQGGTVAWEEPLEGGWRDPGEEEMILDAAFQVVAATSRPRRTVSRPRRSAAEDARSDTGRRRDAPARGIGEGDRAPVPMAASPGEPGAEPMVAPPRG